LQQKINLIRRFLL